MGPCTAGAGWWFGALEWVVAEAEAVGALGASIDAEVWGDLEAFFKDQEAFEGSGGVGTANNG